jgi:hypothetical protein
MHPILAQPRRLGLYLLAWLFAGGLLSLALVFPGGGSALEGLALGLPLGLVYAFVSLAAWYPARAAPLRSAGVSRQLVIHAAAALLSSGAWCVLGVLLARALARLPLFAGAADRFSAALPFLYPVGALLYLLAVALHYLFVAFEESRAAERQALGLLVLAREAELRALRAQINPHFLFNSLNSIASLAGTEPARAREMCVRLADFFRRSLAVGERRSIPISEELSLTRAYLEVERVRFGPRLEVDEAIDAHAESCGVPPLLLQPLVENAVKHGVANALEGGYVRVEVRRAGGRLRIVVANPADPEAEPSRGTGTGLRNVRQRLRARYGENAFFAAKRVAENWLVVISLPVETAPVEAA